MVEKFEESPIIFGDYMKPGASRSDRVYEELVDMKKVFNVLEEVSGIMITVTQSASTRIYTVCLSMQYT